MSNPNILEFNYLLGPSTCGSENVSGPNILEFSYVLRPNAYESDKASNS
jgi:hypothetical protein